MIWSTYNTITYLHTFQVLTNTFFTMPLWGAVNYISQIRKWRQGSSVTYSKPQDPQNAWLLFLPRVLGSICLLLYYPINGPLDTSEKVMAMIPDTDHSTRTTNTGHFQGLSISSKAPHSCCSISGCQRYGPESSGEFFGIEGPNGHGPWQLGDLFCAQTSVTAIGLLPLLLDPCHHQICFRHHCPRPTTAVTGPANLAWKKLSGPNPAQSRRWIWHPCFI